MIKTSNFVQLAGTSKCIAIVSDNNIATIKNEVKVGARLRGHQETRKREYRRVIRQPTGEQYQRQSYLRLLYRLMRVEELIGC